MKTPEEIAHEIMQTTAGYESGPTEAAIAEAIRQARADAAVAVLTAKEIMPVWIRRAVAERIALLTPEMQTQVEEARERHCEGCGALLPPNHPVAYCSNECATADASTRCGR